MSRMTICDFCGATRWEDQDKGWEVVHGEHHYHQYHHKDICPKCLEKKRAEENLASMNRIRASVGLPLKEKP